MLPDCAGFITLKKQAQISQTAVCGKMYDNSNRKKDIFLSKDFSKASPFPYWATQFYTDGISVDLIIQNILFSITAEII